MWLPLKGKHASFQCTSQPLFYYSLCSESLWKITSIWKKQWLKSKDTAQSQGGLSPSSLTSTRTESLWPQMRHTDFLLLFFVSKSKYMLQMLWSWSIPKYLAQSFICMYIILWRPTVRKLNSKELEKTGQTLAQDKGTARGSVPTPHLGQWVMCSEACREPTTLAFSQKGREGTTVTSPLCTLGT